MTSPSEQGSPAFSTQLRQMGEATIDVGEHYANSDPSAVLISAARERLSIFKVRDGFVPVLDGRTYPRTFATEAAAREAARGLGV